MSGSIAHNLDLTIHYAENLKNVRNMPWSTMRVYAKVSINEQQWLTYQTPVDHDGKTNPKWDMKASYTISDESIKGGEDELVIKLYSERSYKEDKYVGEVKVLLKKLWDDRNGDVPKSEEFPVMRADEDGEFGVLHVTYHLYDHVVKNSKRLYEQPQDQTVKSSELLKILTVIAAMINQIYSVKKNGKEAAAEEALPEDLQQKQNQNQVEGQQPRFPILLELAAAASACGSLLILSGLSIAGMVIALTMGAALLVTFSPLLVSMAVAAFLLLSGFLLKKFAHTTREMNANGEHRRRQHGSASNSDQNPSS